MYGFIKLFVQIIDVLGRWSSALFFKVDTEFHDSFDAASVVSSTESWARIPREGLEKESTVIIMMPTGAQLALV